MIYYGDEVDPWGSDDPNNRKPMLWKDLEPYEESGMAVMDDHLAFYQAAVPSKPLHRLRTGSIETILTMTNKMSWRLCVKTMPTGCW